MILLLVIVSALVATVSAACGNVDYTQIAGGDCFKCAGAGKCTWTDGTPYDYNSFNGGMAMPTDGICAAMWDVRGKWFSTQCNQAQDSFVCRIKDKKPIECGDYTQYNDFCMKVKASPRTALTAEEDCVAEGGHLVSIHGESDNAFYRSLLTKNGVNDSALIGLRNSNGNYQWTDGSLYDFKKWAQYFPNSRFGDCVQMILTSELGSPGQWINEDCGTPYPYICKRKSGAQPTKAPTTLTPTMAPSTCPNMQLFEDAGTIYSPGFPISFPPNTRCEYLLTGKTGTQVQVNFPVFNMDASSSVSLYDGMATSNAFAVLSGSASSTRTYITRGNILKMVFKSGNTVSGQGWEAAFTTANPSPSVPPSTVTSGPLPTIAPPRTIAPADVCPKQIYDTDTMIASPGYPGRFSGQMMCVYYIRNPSQSGLKLDFGAIDIGKNSFITVYDGSTTDCPMLGRITGTANAHSYQYEGHGYELTVVFQSTDEGFGAGFTADIKRW